MFEELGVAIAGLDSKKLRAKWRGGSPNMNNSIVEQDADANSYFFNELKV